MKANPRNEPGWIDRQTLVDQLRYGGVLEAVRVARVGYPIIMQPVAFLGRYRTLVDDSGLPLPRKTDGTAEPGLLKTCCDMIVQRMHIKEDDLQVGWDEAVASLHMVSAWRGHLLRSGQSSVETAHCTLHVPSSSTSLPQPLPLLLLELVRCPAQVGKTKVFFRQETQCRVWLAKRVVMAMRKRRAATLFQTRWRAHAAAVRYKRMWRGVWSLQMRHKERLATRRVQALREVRASLRIQRNYRYTSRPL
jgi:myosin-5